MTIHSTTSGPATTHDSPEPTDRLFDVTNIGLARVFGRRTMELMRAGRDPYQAARLAFTFAARVLAERAAEAALLDDVAQLQATGRCGVVTVGVTH